MGLFGRENAAEKLIKTVRASLAKDYPDFVSVRPQVSERSDGTYLLTYNVSFKTEDGLTIRSSLRVAADAKGRILKVSVSR